MLVATRGARAAAWTAPRTLPSSSRGARASCPRASPGSRRPSARSLRPRRGDGFAPAAPPGRGAAVVARAGPGGAGGGDLYALLNVPSTATKKEIKAAYKKAALKFHPDVNKAPDAAERFNEVKQAYQTLADEDSRRRYDALRNGGFGGWKGNTSRRDTSSSRSSRASRPSSSAAGGEAFGARTEDEPFYGFSDFWSDMEKEFAEFEKKRPDLGRPRTLWEELEALGEELVDFLEESAPETTRTSRDPFGTETRTTSSSSSGSARRKDGTASASYTSSSSRTTSSSSSASSSASSASARSRAPPPKRESVDEMLEKLKRDMGMK